MPEPAVQEVCDLAQNEVTTDVKLNKAEGDEEQGGVFDVDSRPAAFKSTFWEICCVAALISAQLANVYLQIDFVLW